LVLRKIKLFLVEIDWRFIDCFDGLTIFYILE
jgi:hypothetical protein